MQEQTMRKENPTVQKTAPPPSRKTSPVKIVNETFSADTAWVPDGVFFGSFVFLV